VTVLIFRTRLREWGDLTAAIGIAMGIAAKIAAMLIAQIENSSP
jgi:hypothetical protein